jgi:hypothetical protein
MSPLAMAPLAVSCWADAVSLGAALRPPRTDEDLVDAADAPWDA